MSGREDTICFLGCCFPENCIICPVAGWEVRCSMCKFPGMISRVSIGSPNAVSEGGAAIFLTLQLDNCQNLQLGHPVFHISFIDAGSRVPHSLLYQCVQPHLVLAKTLNATLHCYRIFNHHPAGFIIVVQLSQLCIIFFRYLIVMVFFFARHFKITHPFSECCYPLCKCSFILSGRKFGLSFIYDIFYVMHSHCLCVCNTVSCHRNFPIIIILTPFLFPFCV